MRAVQSGFYQRFVHGRKCIINSENRRSCKKCRFEKCVQVGMQIKYVRSLEEKCQQKIKEVKLEENFPAQNYIEFYDNSWEAGVWIIYECYIKNPTAFLFHICQSSQMESDTDAFLNFLEHTDSLIFSNFAKLQTEKDGVSAQDCQVLLQTNFTRLQAVQNILVFMENYSEMEDFVKFGHKNREKSRDLDQLMSLYDTHKASNVFHLDYDLFFTSPWALDKDIEKEHKFIFQSIIQWYLRCTNESSQLDKCLLMLIYPILLYNTDSTSTQKLKDIQKIQKLQANYSHLLWQYLNTKHDSQVSRILFGKGLMLVHETQRVYELSQLRLTLPKLD